MNFMSIIAKKELKNYYTSPAAYIVLVGFLLITGWFFSSPLFIMKQATLRSMFNIIPMIFPIFIPAITMGLISREKNNGTIELLTTYPIQDKEIIYGKFMASMILITTGLLFTLVHFFTILFLGKNVDVGQIICGYIGLVFLGGVYSSIGIFASSLSKNQIVSFLISFMIIFFLFILQYILIFLPSALAGIFQYISINYHLSNITRGVIDTRNVVYFISLIMLFLRLSIMTMESRKW